MEYQRIGRRLRELREQNEDTALRLARVLGCAEGTIYHYEKGRRKITLVDLQRIADHYGVSLSYFLGRDTNEDRRAAHFKRLADETQRLRQEVGELGEDYMKDAMLVPLIGTVPGGYPDFRDEEAAEEFYPITRSHIHTEGAYCLRVTGNSMAGRGIMDGDIVFVDKALEPKSGDIIIARQGDEAVIRVYRETKNGVYLEAANSAYAPLHLREAEIIGVVVESRREHR